MDPKLKAPMGEIRAIIKKHDIGAVVVLCSPTHTDYLMEIAPTWSCIREEAPGAIRIRSKLADYPSKAAQKKHLEITTGLLMGLMHVLEVTRGQLEQLVAALAQKMDISHTDTRAPDEPHDFDGPPSRLPQ